MWKRQNRSLTALECWLKVEQKVALAEKVMLTHIIEFVFFVFVCPSTVELT